MAEITERANGSEMRFNELDQGDCFVNNGDYFLKTVALEGGQNCVCMAGGTFHTFRNDSKVRKVKSIEVVI